MVQQGFFRLGQQQILRAMLRLDTVMISKNNHKLEMYTIEDNQWSGMLPFTSKTISMVRPGYEITRAYDWSMNGASYSIAYSGLGEVLEYDRAYVQWMGEGQ